MLSPSVSQEELSPRVSDGMLLPQRSPSRPSCLCHQVLLLLSPSHHPRFSKQNRTLTCNVISTYTCPRIMSAEIGEHTQVTGTHIKMPHLQKPLRSHEPPHPQGNDYPHFQQHSLVWPVFVGTHSVHVSGLVAGCLCPCAVGSRGTTCPWRGIVSIFHRRETRMLLD